jgi:hypothetical protein
MITDTEIPPTPKDQLLFSQESSQHLPKLFPYDPFLDLHQVCTSSLFAGIVIMLQIRDQHIKKLKSASQYYSGDFYHVT